MSGNVCRGCDGRKFIEREDKDNCMKVTRKPCSRCGGSGNEPGPPKGNGRFRGKPKDPDEEPSHEEMVRRFLNGR